MFKHIISSYLIWVGRIPIISRIYLHYITILSPFGLIYLQYHAISLAPADSPSGALGTKSRAEGAGNARLILASIARNLQCLAADEYAT